MGDEDRDKKPAPPKRPEPDRDLGDPRRIEVDPIDVISEESGSENNEQ